MRAAPHRHFGRPAMLCSGLLLCVVLSTLPPFSGSAGAFEPRPVPGRVLLKLHDWVDTATSVGKSTGARGTSQPALDDLNARFAVRSFAAQFPGVLGHVVESCDVW